MEEICDLLRKNERFIVIAGLILSIYFIYQAGKRFGEFLYYLLN